jgi:predicted transcriptional regulator
MVEKRNSSENVSQKSLSPLERKILELLWKKGKGHVLEIYLSLRKKNTIAHTSVAVLLDRLHEKKLVTRAVERCKGGFRYLYYPTSKKEDYHKAVVQTAVDTLIERFGNTATTYFHERFGRKR